MPLPEFDEIEQGWAQGIYELGNRMPTGKVFAIICAKEFPEMNRVLEALKAGRTAHPDATFVVRETDKSARLACEIAGIEPMLAILNPLWKVGDYDGRRIMRDAELRTTCSKIIVFSDGGATTKTEWESYAKQFPKIQVILPKVPIKREPKPRKPTKSVNRRAD